MDNLFSLPSSVQGHRIIDWSLMNVGFAETNETLIQLMEQIQLIFTGTGPV